MKDWSNKYKDVRQVILAERVRLIPLLDQSGVSILAGTDLGFVFIYPGSGLHDELKLLVEAGLSPAKALQTATFNPAIFLNKENEFGTVEKGKVADLVLLDGNPLENINNIDKIYLVVFNGRVFSKGDIDKLLKETEQKNNE